MAAPQALEINTFSAAIDAVVERSGRIDRRNDIISYVRTSLRECQVRPGDAEVKFADDVVEDQLTANADPYIWESGMTFRSMLAVEYPSITDGQGRKIYPRFLTPGKAQFDYPFHYYRSGNSFVFAGHGATSVMTLAINIAYLSFFPTLQYFLDTAFRPARYLINPDGSEGWTYLAAFDVDDTTREAARALVTNWMLEGWFDTIVEGALAKLYKTGGDSRASATYALYKQYQTNLYTGKSMVGTVLL